MNGMGLACVVGLGGAAGTLLRYGIGRWVTARGRHSVLGTLIANLAGSLAMGVLIGIGLEERQASAYALAGIGFLGGLTTYSTLNVQKASLFRGGGRSKALLAWYVTATYAGGFALTAAGVGIGCFVGRQ
ncbi:fluoride efflux transporter FluC [Cohnella hongkongensis]|uniref:Fluoride-specific ion channel FluC n=1 Tax=Cohnella hongkongensis TaxID=178337 RepID=A0ABV9FM74_9BACL